MKKILRLIPILLIATLLIVTPVLAQSYTCDIAVTSTAAYTRLPIVASINNQYLADSGYISTSGLDTRVLLTGTELPHMLANDKTLFASNLNANETTTFTYTFGNSPLSSFPVLVGKDGYVTITDDATLELGNNFKVEFQGYVDTSAGADKNIVFKDLAFKIWISAAGEISASIYNGGWTATVVTAIGVSSGVHSIEVTADVQNFKVEIDGVLKDTAALGGTISVPDNANNWLLLQNNVMPYMEFFKIWVD